MLKRPTPKAGERLLRAATIEKAAGGDGARRITFIASDETVDRYGDIIRASGWKLENFRRNPVLLWAHSSREPPIGRVPDIRVEGTRLIADCDFVPEGVDPFADLVWTLIDQKFVNASSVGFMPLADPKVIRDDDDMITGFEFNDQELLELSVVPVPANPQALAVARAFGADADAQRRLFERDERAIARVAADARRRSITLARLRVGHFDKGDLHA
jgi:Escherichia/Staphylococcus phage prohead protease